jgi:paraquat-inducible protein B
VTIRLYRSNVRVNGKSYDEPLLSKLIGDGLRAELNTVSFVTGQSEIDLDLDSASPAVLHPSLSDLIEIPTKVSDIERVKQQLTQLPLRDLADSAIATLRSVHKLTDTLGDDLPALINSVKSTSDRSGKTVDEASRAIADLQARLDTTLASINQLANSGDRQINLRGADLHLLLLQSAQTVARARDMVNSLQSLTAARAGPRIDIEATLRDLAAAAASLRGFAGDVEHNPQLLLTGRRN